VAGPQVGTAVALAHSALSTVARTVPRVGSFVAKQTVAAARVGGIPPFIQECAYTMIPTPLE